MRCFMLRKIEAKPEVLKAYILDLEETVKVLKRQKEFLRQENKKLRPKKKKRKYYDI